MDIDILCTEPLDPNELALRDWEYGGSRPKSGDSWCSWKRSIPLEDSPECQANLCVNLLICSDPDYIQKWRDASDVCKYINAKLERFGYGSIDRTTAVGIHSIIMDDVDANNLIEKESGSATF